MTHPIESVLSSFLSRGHLRPYFHLKHRRKMIFKIQLSSVSRFFRKNYTAGPVIGTDAENKEVQYIVSETIAFWRIRLTIPRKKLVRFRDGKVVHPVTFFS